MKAAGPRSGAGDPDPSAGRVNQKARTRRHIEAAAHALRKRGELTSLARVAEEADISRATVYRYFSTIDDLKNEIALSVNIKQPDELFDSESGDPKERLLRVHAHLFELVRSHEPEFRAYLRGLMEHWQRNPQARRGMREGRRARLIEAALADTRERLGARDHEQLVRALSLVMFIEPFILLKDIFELDDRDADETMRWAIERLLVGALALRESKRASATRSPIRRASRPTARRT
jgi:AcrR family transcriptional regulator